MVRDPLAVRPQAKRLPWAPTWRRRCPGVLADGTEVVQCDLRRGHHQLGVQEHVADRGMYQLRWLEMVTTARNPV